MKVGVFGAGYVGLVVGTCLAELGNDVILMDIDKEKVSKLKKGHCIIYEPGLEELLKRNIKEKRLDFTNDEKDIIKKSEILFIAVGTPTGEDNNANLEYVYDVAKNIGENMDSYKVVVDKSTVPVGTAENVAKIIKANQKNKIEFDVVSNPEFLREGSAVRDFMAPDRIVVGVKTEKAKKIMLKLYKHLERIDRPILVTDNASAEMIKYASNAMLATRISFMNELAPLCEKVGANIKLVARGMGLDNRIGSRFLQAGIGYGGSCFPKDVKALIATAAFNDINLKILMSVESVNKEQKRYIIPKLKCLLKDIKGKKIAIFGLAFKPKTDDMREAPSIVIIKELQKLGAIINAYDPVAQENAKKLFDNVNYFDTPYDAAKDCDAIVIATEWDIFRELNMKKLKSLLKQPNVVDGRNIYEPKEMKELGFNYMSIGR
jgi:UDPglucose 6-dehydrogenase